MPVAGPAQAAPSAADERGVHYKWIALSNTTLGILMVTINQSILLISYAVFTLFSILLSVTWLTGVPGALWIIIMRVFQGVGGAFLFANSTAILTDAFPANERGKAMGIN